MWFEYLIIFKDDTETLIWIDVEEDFMDQLLEALENPMLNMHIDDVAEYRMTGKKSSYFENLPDEESEEEDEDE